MKTEAYQNKIESFKSVTTEKKQTKKQLILNILKKFPDLTAKEIGSRAYIWMNSCGARINELCSEGKIIVSGKKLCPVSKKTVATFRVVDGDVFNKKQFENTVNEDIEYFIFQLSIMFQDARLSDYAQKRIFNEWLKHYNLKIVRI